MGKASISINIDGRWNGSGAVGAAVNDLGRLNAAVSGSASRMSAYLDSQERQATRMSRLAAATSKSTAKALSESGQSVVEMSGKLYGVGDGLQSVGASLTKHVTAPLVSLAERAGTTAVAYDTALANVRKTTNMTETELQALGKSAVELSKTQPVSAETILNVEALGAQLGIAQGSLEAFAKVATGLDIATDMNAEQAGTEMARFANIVGGMTDDEMSRYASTIVAIGNNMATTESEVSNMAQRFASAGHQAGLSSSEILAMSASMSSLGVRAEMGGSALSQTFVAISQAVSAGGEELDAFAAAAGMSADQFREKWKSSAADAFVDLLRGIHDSAEAGKDMNVTLAELNITGIRQSDVMRRMSGSVDLVTDSLALSRDAWQKNSALQTEVDNRNESMASRLQVLANKVDALAITVGVPLVNAVIEAVDAMEPAIEAVSEAAQGFADMDEESQRAALALAGIAAAAGPLSSAFGGALKGLSEIGAGFGSFLQDASVFSDAMDSIDGAQLRVYKGSGTLAAQMGLTRNKVVEAAGGVERYSDAWSQWYSAAKEAENKNKVILELQNKLDGATRKETESIKKKVDALKGEVAAAEASRDANAELLVGWKQSAGMSEQAAKATTTLAAASGSAADSTASLGGKVKALGGFMGASLVEMGKSALVMGAWGIAIAGVTTVVGSLVQRWVEAEARQRLVNDATKSFADVAADAEAGARSEAEGIDAVAGSAEEALKAMADLNKQFSDTMDEFYTGSATVDDYVGTIERLAGRSDLTATEQQQLANAVKGYNDVTGDSVTVTDAAEGALSKSTEEIQKNADAWKRNAEAQAYQQYAVDLMKQRAETQLQLEKAQGKLTEATTKYNDAQAALDRYMSGQEGEVDRLSQRYYELNGQVAAAKLGYDEAKQPVDELTASLRTQSDDIEWLNQKQAELAANLEGPLKAAFDALPEGMEGVGINIAAKLAQGVRDGTVDAQAAADFLGSSVTAVTETIPDEMQPIGLAASEALANGVSTGEISVDAATSALEQAAQGNIGALPQVFADAGVDCPQSLADAIALYQSMPGEKTDEMLSMVALKLTSGDVEGAAQLLGHDIDAGLAEGIRNGTLSEDQAQKLGQDVIDKAKSALDSHSPSKKFEQIGNDIDAGLAQGIQSGQGGVLEVVGGLVQQLLGPFQEGGLPGQMEQSGALAGNAFASGLGSVGGFVLGSAVTLSQGVIDGISGTASSASGEGTSAGSGFASGVASGKGASLAAAKGLASTMNQLSGVPAAASGFGSRAGQGFAGGVSSGVGPTSSAAGRVADAANGMRNTGNSYSWGSHLASNFASGIRAGIGWVASAASAIAERAASILHFTVPEEGPWSGAERGGFTSGLHLGQNIAAGMRSAAPLVSRAALSLGEASRYAVGQSLPPAQGRVVTNSTTSNVNYYTLNVDGRRLQANPEASELLGKLVDALGATAGAGVRY